MGDAPTPGYPYSEIAFVQERNTPLTDATTWMKLASNILSERSQTKATNCMVSIYIKCPEQANSERQKDQCYEELGWGKIMENDY